MVQDKKRNSIVEFYILVINKDEKQPQTLLKKTNIKSSNIVETWLNEDW